jgi:hypothetical protein
MEMSNEELKQLVQNNCDYPICSMSIVGLKGPVLDEMIQFMTSNAAIIQHVITTRSSMTTTASHQQPSHNTRRTSTTPSDYRSSSEFFTTVPAAPSQSDTQQQHQASYSSKINNESYGSLLSHNSSERTHYRNIPAEEVFQALDSSLMMTTTTTSSPGHRPSKTRENSGKIASSGMNSSTTTSSRHNKSSPTKPPPSSTDTATNPNHDTALLLDGSTPTAVDTTTSITTTVSPSMENTTRSTVPEVPPPNDKKLSQDDQGKDHSAVIDRNHVTVVDVPIDFFDVAEYIIMESLKEQYWIPFTQSTYYTKCKHFLWYQDRKIIPDDFYVLRVLGRGGFGLVTGTSHQHPKKRSHAKM